jgi:D-lactate dehydrogenase (cytochrome)
MDRLSPTALEYMDPNSLSLLRQFREQQGDSSSVPALPEDARQTLYIEAGLASEEEMDLFAEKLELVLADHGLSMDEVWAGFTAREREAMKKFRHALPERINAIISERKRRMPDLTKVGTDMAVPLDSLGEMMEAYRSSLAQAGLEYCIFGHIGNGHVHVNILPRSPEDQTKAWDLYRDYAKKAVSLEGSVAGEHGIGRLKRKFMEIQYTGQEMTRMRSIKNCLDPDGRLNPGVMF